MAHPILPWLLVIVSLPSSSATARMRVWRSLKGLGCGMLRDGAYLLPDGSMQREQLQTLCDETIREGGNAWLLTVKAASTVEDQAFQALFARDDEYVEFGRALATARKELAQSQASDVSRMLRKLRKDYESLRTIDYFPGEASRQAEANWMDFIQMAELILSPGEPQAIRAAIARLDRQDYQGRIWATRRRIWVDRVACAWLIRRFIDPDARFIWLASPADCPPEALGFDFDGAAFTHIGDRVSFEVLLASFGLDADRGLARLGALVHALDAGNGFVPEASGFEAMLAGARQRTADDDQLLAEISVVLDWLYTHFSDTPKTPSGNS